MTPREIAERIVASRAALRSGHAPQPAARKGEAEGGCGVIGMACAEAVPGRHLLQALRQMRNRGNGKGGGVAMVGLVPEEFGVTPAILRDDYLLAVAYLDASARPEVESAHIHPTFLVDHTVTFPIADLPGLPVRPPQVVAYFVRVRPDAAQVFAAQIGSAAVPQEALQDELVYQNSFRLNRAWYSSLGEKRAFVLSHGKDLLVLKMVGYGDDAIQTYGLENLRAHVWIGHHRYPTKGRVWHPGGAHPFVGLHEALVHNGDFANYASVCAYLAQRNIEPLFLTDTEVSVLMFDLLHRTYGYPLEYVIEALAPTTERDFTRLPPAKQEIYRALQTVHIHGSPDGPWFFLIAQSAPNGGGSRTARLIGITDTSMLRPQVFALQDPGGAGPAIGFAASEKQAIDAALESLAAEDQRFWGRADLVWNARGGSHTDGGAFVFTVERDGSESARLRCADKFGRPIRVEETAPAWQRSGSAPGPGADESAETRGSAADLFAHVVERVQSWSYWDAQRFCDRLVPWFADDEGRRPALEALGLLIDRRYPTGSLRRSCLLSLFDAALSSLFQAVRRQPSSGFGFHEHGRPLPQPEAEDW